MTSVDLFLCAILVAFAASYLGWRLFRRDKTPACHPVEDSVPNVVVKGALARGLKRAQTQRPH